MLFFKTLELHGFKTFANKTTVNLLPGITVIVGPNGCGKSNIFDGIRWVLGEQSAKSMRGARMGDVIFNGSSSLKATGMARIDLVLNNAHRSLPIDFDEVSISRRLFRTGESEYMLNKTNCRLKDIHNLLMDTGIGTDSYSIMEQGKVDAIINSKPMERRALFDEAAGISKYKMRKDEALNKLARTDDDLLRLSDIIAEVRRQAGSLKRQAGKAERYKKYSAELRAVEMELLVCRWHAFRESTASTEELYQMLFASVNELREELRKLDEDQLSGRVNADEVQRHLDETQAIHFSVNSELQETTGRIALLEQRIADAGERNERLVQQIAEFDAKAQELTGVASQMETDITAQTENIGQLRMDYSARKERYDALKSDTDVSISEIARMRQDINELNRARMEKDNESRVARAMEEKLTTELENSDAELALLQQQIEALASQRDETQSQADENDQVLAALKTDLQTLKQNLSTCDADFSRASADLDHAKRSAQACQSRHDALAELQENFEGYYRGVREVMIASRNGTLNGILGVVSTLVEAKPEHELAIEVALGAQAQDIVVDRAEDGKAAIRWLKEQKVGRATFLPLDLIEARETSQHLREVTGEPGVIGFATDLVSYNPRITTAVQYLLGNVIVCENLDVAVSLERRGFRTKFVTLEGDMLSSHGAMSGGSVKAAGLLHRTREVRELADQLTQLRRVQEETEARVFSLRSQLTEMRDRHEKLASSAQQQEIDAARTRKDFEVIAQKHGEKQGALEQLQGRRGAMHDEIETHRRKQEEAGGILADLMTRAATVEEVLTRIENEASERQQEVAYFAGEMNDLMISISTSDERLNNLRERLASNESEQLRVMAARTERQGEIEKLRQQQDEAQEEIRSLRQRIDELRTRQQDITHQITFETQRKETISLDLRKLGERSQEVQRDLNEGQNELHEVELKRAEYTVQLESIGMQAREKFGHELEEVVAEVLEAAQIEDPGMLRQQEEIMARITDLRMSIDNLGPVHVGAIDEYNELNARYEFLTNQEQDLVQAKTQLTETIHKIDETSKDIFSTAFEEIRTNFEQVFRRLFGGGRADLLLTEENGVLESGIDIVAQPPGKKPQHISLLSGGEKALTAIALLFAIFMRKPSPFCILDEIDAPLDDKNIERFKELVREFSHTTQFIIITHNKQTMALANTIYGVTMEEQGVSRIVSVKLDEVESSNLLREKVPA